MNDKNIPAQSLTKRTFSYNDLTNFKSHSIYSAVGSSIDPQLPSAPRATFGKSQRQASNKKYEGRELQKFMTGKDGIGPAGYLPPRHILPNGQVVQENKDPAILIKYESVPSFSIGKQSRKLTETINYEYMNHEDRLDIDQADLKRRRSSSGILIGTARRFSQQRLDKITPGPTYDPVNKPELQNAPKYTMTSRKMQKDQDPMAPRGSTTTLVGPGAYFQKVKKSHSTSSLSRIPYDSKIPKQPIISFTKAPRTLQQIKNSVDQTYDIKSKTIMAHYDFQYDGGKGYQSGKSFMKKNIITATQNPLQRNKMGSFTMSKTTRQQQQQKRGRFIATMSQVPQSVRIQIPKF